MSKEKFAVIIAGSRTFDGYELLCEKCDLFFSRRKPTLILCGEAEGADTLGKKYAFDRGLAVEPHPADWRKNGRGAGYMRNREMLKTADALVAFWDGSSRGTKHMIDIAKEAGIPVRVVISNGEVLDDV